MCDDHEQGIPSQQSALSRRGFLHASAGAAAAAAMFKGFPRLPLRSAARGVTVDGSAAYSMAMHVHSSFSEQQGSMGAQLYQATVNSVDVCWWTDHDARMEALGYRDVTHFTSFAEQGAPGQGGAWQWQKRTSGPLTRQSTGGIVQAPCSPNDPVAGGALHLQAQSATGAPASYGYYAESHPAGWNYRDNLTGQSLLIDVLLSAGWSRGYLELLIGTSCHPASGGRPAGNYTLSYRFTPGGTATQAASGNTGIIMLPVTAAWQTATLTPSADIAALWPDLDYRDFALWELTFNAVSTGDLASGYFDYLRMDRTISGQAQLSEQASMMAAIASGYPSVTQYQGSELSPWLPHLNWFGPGITLPDYTGQTYQSYPSFMAQTVVPGIHASGGLASYNHPFGYNDGPLQSTSAQDSKVAATASAFLGNSVLGCDLLEVGYHLRGGCDTAHHLALWDVMSRNAVFLTGSGVNDDHSAQNWASLGNNWVTWVWAASMAMGDLLAALAAGRSWCANLAAFPRPGSLDLLVDGLVPMGSVSVSSARSRSLQLTATGMPAGSTLQLLQGPVDYAGQNGLAPATTVAGSYQASQLAGGSVTQAVDTSSGSFLRTQVLSPSGAIIAASNPVWLLQAPPPNGIPPPRQA